MSLLFKMIFNNKQHLTLYQIWLGILLLESINICFIDLDTRLSSKQNKVFKKSDRIKTTKTKILIKPQNNLSQSNLT